MDLTNEELLIADQVIDVLDNVVNGDSYEIEEDTLQLVDKTDTDFILKENDEIFISEKSYFTVDYMKKVVDFARPGIAFTTMQHAFPMVKYAMQLVRFREYVEFQILPSNTVKKSYKIFFANVKFFKEKE